jgi:hypothetical protein
VSHECVWFARIVSIDGGQESLVSPAFVWYEHIVFTCIEVESRSCLIIVNGFNTDYVDRGLESCSCRMIVNGLNTEYIDRGGERRVSHDCIWFEHSVCRSRSRAARVVSFCLMAVFVV